MSSPRKCLEGRKTDHARFRIFREPSVQLNTSECVYSSSETFCTHAILDTGASRCIIGEKTLERLKLALSTNLTQKFRKKASQVRFRFGNNASLTSQYAIQIPLKHRENRKLWISIEVVPGLTPFLFPKRAFKLLHGSLDSQHDMCWMAKVQKEPIPLATSPTGLYLLNMMDICPLAESAFSHSDFIFCSSKTKLGVNLTSGVQVVRGNEVDGVNQFPSAALELSARPPPTRSFRSRDQSCVSSGFPLTRYSHANHGDHSQDHHRGHPAFATSDFCAPAGKAGECHRSGLRARCDDTKPTVGDDATDPGSKDSFGCPERRGDQSKAQSRTCGKIGKQGFRPFCLSRKPDEESSSAKHSFEPTPKSSTIHHISGSQLAGDRRGGRDRGAGKFNSHCAAHANQPRRSSSCPHFALAGQPHSGRMGNQRDQVRPQAQGQDLCLRDAARSKLPAMESGQIRESDDSMYSSFQSSSQHKRVWLLEVYANTHSPLTEAVGRLGYWAIRFTKQDGDLATFAGRHKLWSWIEKYQPEHIWMAPECGPWGG